MGLEEDCRSVHDPLLGTVEVTRDLVGRRFTVGGEGLPTASITRSATTAPVREHVPIGTRRAADLSLVLDGEPALLRPSPGRLSRRSFRVRVECGGSRWLFTPATPDATRLVRGTRYRGDNELGMFTLDHDGDVFAEWSQDIEVLGMTARGLRPTPSEGVLGYLLSASFGTGAQLVLAAIFGEGGEMLFPG